MHKNVKNIWPPLRHLLPSDSVMLLAVVHGLEGISIGYHEILVNTGIIKTGHPLTWCGKSVCEKVIEKLPF